MLPTDPELPPVDAAHCVSDDQDVFSGQHLIQPAIEYPIGDNFGAEFLGKFALEAGHRIFAAFQPTAWQLPLVAFIQQKPDPVVL